MMFSIIIPVYNVEDKIAKCLQSIQNQSYKDFEAIIVIDGSQDMSESICRNFEREDPHIKVIYKDNGGLVSARKHGAELATGDYIVNIDGDDYVDKDYLWNASKIIKKYSPDMIAYGYTSVSDKLTKYINNLHAGFYDNKIDLDEIKSEVVYDKTQKGFQGGILINSIWAKVVKRSLYQDCQRMVPNHITVGEDLLLNVLLIGKINNIYVSEETYYNYIVSPVSMMHKYNVKNFEHYLDVAKELNEIEYVQPNDVDVYLQQAYISEIKKLSKACLNYPEFKKMYNSNNKIRELRKHAVKARVVNKRIKDQVKSALTHSTGCFILYSVCKYF